nr:hypothetical protein [Rhodococcus sp. BP22]
MSGDDLGGVSVVDDVHRSPVGEGVASRSLGDFDIQSLTAQKQGLPQHTVEIEQTAAYLIRETQHVVDAKLPAAAAAEAQNHQHF